MPRPTYGCCYKRRPAPSPGGACTAEITTMKPILLFALSLMLLVAPLCADEVTLKNGTVHKGVILEQSATFVRIETADGKVMRIKQDEISSVAESMETGDAVLDEKLKGASGDSAQAVADAAVAAKEAGSKAWALGARLALRRDEANDTAHELLGHMKVGEKWFTNRKDAEAALSKELAEKYKAEGYLKYKDGWIKKEDLPAAQKDANAFLKGDDLIYRDKATVMKAQGFTLVGGKWIKAGSPEDQAAMTKFKELTGESIWIHTTPHFKLHMQQYQPDKVAEFGDLMEKVYAWFVKTMKKPPEFDVFRGNQGHIWVLKDKNAVMDWYKNYRNRYSLDDGFGTLLERGGGNVHHPPQLIATQVPNQSGDIRNQLVHVAGHFLIGHFCRGVEHGTPAWLAEAFGHLAEDVHLGNGMVNCSSLAKYAAGGGVAEKEFSTKDAKDRGKALARTKKDAPFSELHALDLNSLNGDHLTKGWTLLAWMLKMHPDQLVAWIEGMNTARAEEALAKATEGWSTEQLDDEWRKILKTGF